MTVLLTRLEAARVLRMSVRSVDRLRAAGQLVTVQPTPHKTLVTRASVEAIIGQTVEIRPRRGPIPTTDPRPACALPATWPALLKRQTIANGGEATPAAQPAARTGRMPGHTTKNAARGQASGVSAEAL